MGTLNYSTTIAASKTVGEIQTMLAVHGASHIGVEYAAGSPISVAFVLVTPHGPRRFNLPVNVDAMHRLLVDQDRKGKLKAGRKDVRSSREQAERVAWRVIKDWLAAQLALVETQMAGIDQVMLPYLVVDGERTLYSAYKERETLAQIEGA